MNERLQFYIDGRWVDPVAPHALDVINPATEEAFARISLGGRADVDAAVGAARRAFHSFSRTSKDDRLAVLYAIFAAYHRRVDEMAETISLEMGAPINLARAAQAASGLAHISEAIRVLEHFDFERLVDKTALLYEPVGVCALITPWNWPINQIACKVAPALAAGCTMVLKPSEAAPMSALLFADILHDAGVPAGVFNLVNGDGPAVGTALATHPQVDMVSFTGSTRAGVAVAKNAADTVKRVSQELGGKSANIILDDADLEAAVVSGVRSCFLNSGQSCNAPSRMLVPRALLEQAEAIAKRTAERMRVGDPLSTEIDLGPLATEAQFDRVQALIAQGVAEGATLVTGGTGRPETLNRGWYVRPTIFSGVTNDMVIAQEEVFGPVLAILPYDDEDHAIRIANDTVYGLSGHVHSASRERALEVATQLRTGNVHLNGAGPDFTAPFGGYKQSGNGREWGQAGFEEFLEVKAVFGCAA
jgi:aldehyde dehydrogenase (NAD+)